MMHDDLAGLRERLLAEIAQQADAAAQTGRAAQGGGGNIANGRRRLWPVLPMPGYDRNEAARGRSGNRILRRLRG